MALSLIVSGINLAAIASLNGVLLLSTIAVSPNYDRSFTYTDKLPIQLAQNRRSNNISVAEIARQVTVRILANDEGGSGVIIGRQGQTYTVLTCDHVVSKKGNRYRILTPDGSTYSARLQPSAKFGDNDLALVQFTSDRTYEVVSMGYSDSLSVGDPVYASGFPNWYMINRDAIENTRDWGLRAFRVTKGDVGMIAERSLPRGYQLGYSNEIQDGMSGGPVLNSNGELVGINGRLKFPPQGIQAYRFADGSAPSQGLFQRMEELSWAIPIATFQQRFR
ncbi:S1 family peptidase [Argonema galeatum]|uniref:S1 family peptidase n=1 Tax=Argonema galeatum TaxID=2942762 RepID=UPI0020119363|nr:serine protease [Argonema galeatum A003/A1]